MDAKDFLKDVVDYIEASQEAIGELTKAAAESKAPSFSDEALEKTASQLVEAGLLSADRAQDAVQAWKRSPDKVLEGLRKVASVKTPASTDMRIGTPVQKRASESSAVPVRESDRTFLESFGLA